MKTMLMRIAVDVANEVAVETASKGSKKYENGEGPGRSKDSVWN